jgi:hypothetical protein
VQGSYEASDEAKAALVKLAQVISDPDQRKAFQDDAASALGRDYDALPQTVRDGFEGLSLEELELLSRVCDRLVEAGFYIELPSGRVCFF